MEEVEPLPLEELLQPLGNGAPCGRNLRAAGYDPLLDALRNEVKEALSAERQAENRGEDPTFVAHQQWADIEERAQSILREHSKDLDAVACLAQAAIRTRRLRGLADGFALIKELVERYWPAMLERAGVGGDDSDDVELIDALLRPISQLNESPTGKTAEALLAVPLQRIPVTDGRDAGSYALWHYDQANNTLAAQKASDEKKDAARAFLETFRRSAAMTAKLQPEYFARLRAEVSLAIERLEAMEQAFEKCLADYEERFTAAAMTSPVPRMNRIKERLEDIDRCLKFAAKEFLGPAAAATVPSPVAARSSNGSAASGAGPAKFAAAPPSAVVDREAAFEQLLQIADFFAATEPLSLLAEQIRQVVERGRLPAKQYFEDLIDNADVRKQFFRLVGIREPAPGEEGASEPSDD